MEEDEISVGSGAQEKARRDIKGLKKSPLGHRFSRSQLGTSPDIEKTIMDTIAEASFRKRTIDSGERRVLVTEGTEDQNEELSEAEGSVTATVK